jgi:hypothetical protein
VELINPYAVMRSTATLEAYKARQRGMGMATQPFSTLGVICGIAGWSLVVVAPTEKWLFVHLGPFAILIPAGLFLVGGASVAIGFMRMRRYQREHPIPDEWRQVPRIKPRKL